MPRLKALKNVFLAAVLACALLAIPAAGFVTPMPILTRALGAVGSTGINWPWVVVLLFILGLSLLRRRFWCNYLCPTGALLSAVSRFSLFRRIRNDSCFQCGRCRPACAFDAIRDDFTTGADCTFCLSCGKECPAGAIEFAIAGRRADAPVPPVDAGRRQFIIGTGAAGGLLLLGGGLSISATRDRFRPPGSLPGDEFRARCIRCGACAVSCPGSAIETVGFTGGLPDYGTPELTPWLCMPNCTRCGRVCPTAAIRSLTLDEKRRTSVGIARHIDTLCIPRREIGNCTICHDACQRTRRNAIYFEERVVSYPNPQDASAEVSVRFQIPMVDAARCIGCGACLRACERENVLQRGVLPGPAIRLEPYREQVLLDE